MNRAYIAGIDWLALSRKRAIRVPALVLALFLFVGGAWYSISQLQLSLSDLRLGPLAILATLMLPSLLYGGIGISLLARAGGVGISLGKSTVIGAYSYLAELLPIPGGAIVRAGALMKAGGTLKRSSALVILTAVLWVSLAMIGAGFSLIAEGPHLSLPLLLTGSALTVLIFGWLWSTAGLAVATLTLLHRCAGIGLVALRLKFAFAALHASAGLTDTLPFVLALLLGSASAVAPSGLGVSESLAALAATASPYSSGTAFLAVAIDRLCSLLACALMAGFAQLRVIRAADRAETCVAGGEKT